MERGRREKRDQNPGSGRRKNDRTKDGIGLTEGDLNHEIWKKDSGVRGNSSSQSQENTDSFCSEKIIIFLSKETEFLQKYFYSIDLCNQVV